MRKILLLLMAMMFLASCGTTAPSKSTFLGEYSKNLGPGPEGGAKERWLKPGVNFAKYNKVMLDHVVFFFADDSQYKGIDTSDLNELAEKFDRAILDALAGRYPVVVEPGPNVIRIRIAITDLKQNTPALGVVSTVAMATPIGLGVNLIKRGTTGSWTGSGATSAEFLALDSMTNEVIVAAKDKRAAGFTARYTKWGSAEEAFRFWGERIVAALDAATAAK